VGFRIFLSRYFGTDRKIIIFLCVPKKHTEKFVTHRNIRVSISDSAWRAPLLQGRATATEIAGCGPPLLRGRAAPLAGGRAVLRLPPSAESPKKRGERKGKEICGWGEVG